MKSILLPFILTTILTFSRTAFSYTFIVKNPPRYTVNQLIFNAANDGCPTLELSPNDLLDLVEDAMDKFWNTVSESRLKLKRGKVLNITSRDKVDAMDFIHVHGVKNTVIVGCNPNFSITELGKGGFGFGTQGMKGGFVLSDSDTVAGFSKSQMMALIAHEIGHTIGLGHSSHEDSLMYFLLNHDIEALTEDDEQGMISLYPLE